MLESFARQREEFSMAIEMEGKENYPMRRNAPDRDSISSAQSARGSSEAGRNIGIKYKQLMKMGKSIDEGGHMTAESDVQPYNSYGSAV